jgi:hypothetical protein
MRLAVLRPSMSVTRLSHPIDPEAAEKWFYAFAGRCPFKVQNKTMVVSSLPAQAEWEFSSVKC